MFAMWAASAPNSEDFGCGFQENLAAGTRSSTLRVFAISWSNSGNKVSLIFIYDPCWGESTAQAILGEDRAKVKTLPKEQGNWNPDRPWAHPIWWKATGVSLPGRSIC